MCLNSCVSLSHHIRDPSAAELSRGDSNWWERWPDLVQENDKAECSGDTLRKVAATGKDKVTIWDFVADSTLSIDQGKLERAKISV